MDLNYLAIVIATVLQFALSAIWYTPVFGKLWGRIHGFDKLSKDVQLKMMKGMGPILSVQFFFTMVTTVVLAIFMAGVPDWNPYGFAGFLWIGFVVPTHVSGVLFGGTERKWIVPKLAIMSGASLGCLLIAAAVLNVM